MKILGINFGNKQADKALLPNTELYNLKPKVLNAYDGMTRPLYTFSYTGEKNLGELGPVLDYKLDYSSLRYRSWQALIDSEIASVIVKRKVRWVIGQGLKLQSEPSKKVLQMEGLPNDTNEFSEQVEARFSLFAKSTMSDFKNMQSLHKIAKAAYTNAIVGGDVLVILRYIDGLTKVQLVDGSHVKNPNYFTLKNTETGNEIRHGIEILDSGEHVAYYICTRDKPMGERILAKSNSTGLLMSFMLYGWEYRLDDLRGLPILSAIFEELKKIERYKSATLGSAEEQAKIPFTIEHNVHSTGENPLLQNLSKAFNADGDKQSDLPFTDDGKALINTFAATANKTAINMPIGSKAVMHENKGTLNFSDFYKTNANVLCATAEIPPEVAFSKYDSNFSSSRAAIKDWEHTILDDRAGFIFYQNVYNFWLETEILKNKINAPGYLTAKVEKNLYVIESYRNARWVGSNVPHIDPLKEVNAERAKLGKSADNIPLTTVEAATEALNGGESDANIEQFASELKYAKELGILKITEQKAKQQS